MMSDRSARVALPGAIFFDCGSLIGCATRLTTLEEPMSIAYLRSLSRMHQTLEREIAREMRVRDTDTLHVTRLKKLKLSIKDRIAKVRRERSADPVPT